jgi:hypothetical protein
VKERLWRSDDRGGETLLSSCKTTVGTVIGGRCLGAN